MEICRIVLTGGPCAGKTTGIQRIRDVFEKSNIRVFAVPETSTELYQGGITPQDYLNDSDFETCFLRLQIEKENTYLAAALGSGCEKALIVYDRGALDSKGYLSERLFRRVLENLNITEETLLRRYDAVIHMEAAAFAGEDFCESEEKTIRKESPAQVIALDKRLADAWRKHPHFSTIGNEYDVEMKMDRLIREIQEIILKLNRYRQSPPLSRRGVGGGQGDLPVSGGV